MKLFRCHCRRLFRLLLLSPFLSHSRCVHVHSWHAGEKSIVPHILLLLSNVKCEEKKKIHVNKCIELALELEATTMTVTGRGRRLVISLGLSIGRLLFLFLSLFIVLFLFANNYRPQQHLIYYFIF